MADELLGTVLAVLVPRVAARGRLRKFVVGPGSASFCRSTSPSCGHSSGASHQTADAGSSRSGSGLCVQATVESASFCADKPLHASPGRCRRLSHVRGPDRLAVCRCRLGGSCWPAMNDVSSQRTAFEVIRLRIRLCSARRILLSREKRQDAAATVRRMPDAARQISRFAR
jgi:hypothetical protein